MIKVSRLRLVSVIFSCLLFLLMSRTVFAWVEHPTNPIYDPTVVAEKAYYPSVIKMGVGDYRMWYQSNSTSTNTTVAYAISTDGISWTLVTNAVTGLIPNNAGHPHVEYADGKFMIWYWNAATPYSNAAMHHAESVDGINWTNDSAITGNLTTTVGGQWNSGIYGAVDVIINDAPTNIGTNPFDYKYAMYFDATSGGYEQIALGYSVDGIAWTLYGTGPVLPKGPVGSWDSGYVAIGSTVIQGNFWTMWYSGGISSSNEGMGCATSIDGFEWTKCPNNPVMSKADGVAWRSSRTYTPKIIRDDDVYKMWFTGRDAAGNYAIGYATSDPLSVSGNLYLKKKSSGEATLPVNATDINLDNESVLNLASTVNVASAGTVILADVSIPLSNFTSGDLTSVDLSVAKNVGGKSVTVGKAIKLSSGTSGTRTKIKNSELVNAEVLIPDSTAILAPSTWDGIIVPPKTGVTSGDTAPSGFSIGTAVDIGSPTEILLFDKPVQVIMAGIAGSVGYKPAGLTVWTRISNTCAGTYVSPTLSASAFPGECSITNGVDTKILTYHLTTFGELIPVATTISDFGVAGTYSVIAGTFTNANTPPQTIINGDVCYTTAPTTPPVTTTGTITVPCDPAVETAQNNVLSDLNAQACTFLGAIVYLDTTTVGANPPGTFPPGCYSSTGAMNITPGAVVTLSGAGTYIFRPAGALSTGANSRVVLADGASAADVFWTPTGGTTLGANVIATTTPTFVGNIFRGVAAGLSITFGHFANLLGRTLAFGSTVTTDANTITVPTASVPPVAPATLRIVKLVVNGSGGTGPGILVPLDFSVHVKDSLGAEVSGSPAPGVSAPGTMYSLSPGSYIVSEDIAPTYVRTFTGTACDSNGNVTLASGDDKTCTIVNTDIPLPAVVPPVISGSSGATYRAPMIVPVIGILKIPTPLALPEGPGSVTYDYAVWNVGGLQSLANINVVDDKCGPVSYVSGDENNNNKLDKREIWKYSCVATLSETTTNTAIATGKSDDNYNLISAATAVSTVVVGSPSPAPIINVIKVPNRLTPLPIEGGEVEYTYAVTNPGVVAMSNVNVVDDKCGPVSYVSGDENVNNLLDPGETWVYTCKANIFVSTRNVATAEGRGNGFIALGYGFSTVLVSSPGFPETGTISDTIPYFPAVGSPADSMIQAKTIAINLYEGWRNNDVATLQQFLISQDIGQAAKNLADVGPTSYFGVLTRAALAEFQSRVGIYPPLGNFGPITREYIKTH